MFFSILNIIKSPWRELRYNLSNFGYYLFRVRKRNCHPLMKARGDSYAPCRESCYLTFLFVGMFQVNSYKLRHEIELGKQITLDLEHEISITLNMESDQLFAASVNLTKKRTASQPFGGMFFEMLGLIPDIITITSIHVV